MAGGGARSSESTEQEAGPTPVDQLSEHAENFYNTQRTQFGVIFISSLILYCAGAIATIVSVAGLPLFAETQAYSRSGLILHTLRSAASLFGFGCLAAIFCAGMAAVAVECWTRAWGQSESVKKGVEGAGNFASFIAWTSGFTAFVAAVWGTVLVAG